MNGHDKLEIWSQYAAISRTWVHLFDAKAGFITAINLGLIAALWSGSVLIADNEISLLTKCAGGTTTLFSIASVLMALLAILPRDKLKQIFTGKKWSSHYHPLSFYGYVSKNFSIQDFQAFQKIANEQNIAALADEALEQHFVISHTVNIKSKWVEWSGYFLVLAFIGTAITLLARLNT